MVERGKGILNRRISRWQISSTAAIAYHLPRLPPRDDKFFDPFNNAHALTVNFNYMVGSSIATLLFLGSPSAIIWLIISIIFLSVYRMLWGWLWPHVGKEVFEAVFPAVTYDNAARSVNRVFVVCCKIATRLHARPTIILSTLRLIVCSVCSVPPQEFGSSFSRQTSATTSGLSEIGCRRNRNISAIALAFPHRIARTFNFHASNNQKSAKALVG